MRVQLKAGAEFDVLSPEEHQRVAEQQTDRIIRAIGRIPLIRRETTTFIPDANGNVGAGAFHALADGAPGQGVFRAPEGFIFQAHRWALNSFAYSPGSPLTSGSIYVYRNDFSQGNLVWFLPVSGSTALIPAVLAWGRDAPWLLNGERFLLFGSSLPTGTQFSITVEGELWPMEAKVPGPPQTLTPGSASSSWPSL